MVNGTESTNRAASIVGHIKYNARLGLALSAVVTVVAVLGAPQKW